MKIIFRSVMHVGNDFFTLILIFFGLKMTWIALYYTYKHQKLTSNSFFNVLQSTYNLILEVMIAFLVFTLVRELHIHMYLVTNSCLGHVGPDVKRSIKPLFIKKINWTSIKNGARCLPFFKTIREEKQVHLRKVFILVALLFRFNISGN